MTKRTQCPARLRVAIVGVGRFGALHARVWREAGAELVGLCDVDGPRLSMIAERFGVTEVDVDAEQLISRVRPDVVVIASDEQTHAPLALVALAAGCHVFVEKPLALSSVDAWHVHDAAEAAGRQVITGQISRFATPYRRMRETVRHGSIGSVCAIRLRRDFSRAWFRDFGTRVHPVWESCVHDIDLAIAFVGQPAIRATAVSSAVAGAAAASVVAALLEFKTGVIATIESAWLVPDAAPQTMSGALELAGSIVGEAEILGLEGILRQRLVADALSEWTGHGVAVPDLSLWPEEDGQVQGALRREVEYSIDVIAGLRAHDIIPLEEACWGVEAAEAIIESLRTGGPVPVARRGSAGPAVAAGPAEA
jgi:predicted dehydrogenase